MARTDEEAASFRSQLSPVFFLAVIFLINFTSRIILSPLLPTIERELAISHSQAGFFFFLSSGGYLVGLLLSGLFASRSTHRLAIIVSIAGVGIAMLTVALATSLWLMRCGLFGVGFAAGLYLPSAIATITSLVDKRHWGKAISVHELAPNVAFFVSPFIAELLALSRSYGPILGLLGGWASDKLGAKQTIVISLVFTGAATLLLGLLSDHWLSGAVLFQPLVAVWFFPAAFAAIAMITPPNARNLAVAFSVPFGFLIGGGAIPTFIGAMGDAGTLSTSRVGDQDGASTPTV